MFTVELCIIGRAMRGSDPDAEHCFGDKFMSFINIAKGTRTLGIFPFPTARFLLIFNVTHFIVWPSAENTNGTEGKAKWLRVVSEVRR